MVLFRFLTFYSLFWFARVKKICVIHRYNFRRKRFFFSFKTFEKA
jgi:hypothetical protein